MTNNIDWMESAVCRQTDLELWFPDRENPAGLIRTINRARNICRSCPVQIECLDYALANNEKYGIYGGINFGTTRGKTRRDLRRERGIQVRDAFEHGTEAGARAHYRRNEPVCVACRNAAAAVRRQREA
jgi:WhiB family redox-sensing transcriptional regulator